MSTYTAKKVKLGLIQALVFFAVFYSENSIAQEMAVASKNIFLEVGGNGFGTSVNYEHQMSNHNIARIGVGYVHTSDYEFVLIPVMIGKLMIKKKHAWEASIGLTFFQHNPDPIGYDLTGTIGYRRYISHNKFYLKTAFTPFLTLSDHKYQYYPFLGVGFGFQF